MEKKKILGLALLTIMLAMPMMISLVEATEWIEVTRFTGSGTQIYTTDYFTCNHVEWRIRWEYTPGRLSSFSVTSYEQGEDLWRINHIYKSGDKETSGISYIHDEQGTFYMKIRVSTESYKIIVEQDVDSIPEFTPFTLIVVLIAVSMLVILLRKPKEVKNEWVIKRRSVLRLQSLT